MRHKTRNKKERILVTGGAGFIASHIVDAYVALGHKVIVVDNLLTGFKKNLNPNAKFYKTDITNFVELSRIFKKERPTIVNHHAAITEVAKSLRDPIPTMKTNVLGTTNVLVCASTVKIKKIIFASSGGTIYGELKKLPATEDMPLRPISPYALSKLFGEQIIDLYSKLNGFKYTIFRYANVYGPRQNPKGEAGVIAIFSGLLKEGGRPVIFGDGSKTRDYLSVKDVVRANVLALSKGDGQTMNLGTSKEISDQKIFDTVAKEFNYKGNPLYAPARKGEILNICLSYKKAKKILGWKPKVPFVKGTKETIAWYKKRALSI